MKLPLIFSSLSFLLALTPLLHGSDPVGLTPNEIAHFLAGDRTGKLDAENSGEAQAYRTSLAESWKRLERSRLSLIQNWAATELGSLRNKPQPIYYPFSGPDFVYVHTFFPNGSVYVLGGLEPVGALPDLTKLDSEGFTSMYQEILTSMTTILNASFFKTNDMKKDFAQSHLDGVVPLLAIFMVCSGSDIEEVTPVRLSHDGSVQPSATRTNGVKIVFQKASQPPQTLYYFQVDVSDDGTKGPSLPQFITNLGPGVTFLKSASYLMHRDGFSVIRSALLKNSVGLLEDDSGIPLKFFPTKEWKVTPYGHYLSPINLFAVRFQPDLRALYEQDPKPKELPFGIGYKFVREESMLLWAVKKGDGR